MIIWINGTFGAGKTTTGTLLAERDPHWRTFDPEWVGYMLRNNLADHPVTDFQHYDSWRRLTPLIADEIARATGQGLVTIQTVLDESYWDELESAFSALGHEIFHVVLEARDDVMVQRIDEDEVETGARQWRLDHLAAYADARPWMEAKADLFLDTSALMPDEAVEKIWAAMPAPPRTS
ncbi:MULTISPECIES: AAA family ATPase [Nocardioides]|uniref:AAA family ATPase n=1 Tax=Nocardioides TaxID=1839 RepID=UPI00032D7EBD|nr:MULTISPECIES: AAA family ATPase [Nocardioides]EON24699.1 hypothetical protein CF8_1184 [Nocardioides sp. CF8]